MKSEFLFKKIFLVFGCLILILGLFACNNVNDIEIKKDSSISENLNKGENADSEDKVILESGEDFDMNLEEGVHLQYTLLNLQKTINFKASKKDEKLIIYGNTSGGKLDFEVKLGENLHRVSFYGEEEATYEFATKKNEESFVKISAQDSEGEFKIELK
ncbi:hypothetical protein LV469_07050 [Peptoniphilus sp. GNH]|nr:hypothetical protein LV469_07050 [Peptoniphilus sp. GNH]